MCMFYFALFVCVCISITGKMSRCALTIYIMTLFSHTLTLQNVYNSIKSNTINQRKPVFSFIKPLSPSLSSTKHLVLYYIWKIFGKYKSKQVYFMVNVVFLFEIRYKCQNGECQNIRFIETDVTRKIQSCFFVQFNQLNQIGFKNIETLS